MGFGAIITSGENHQPLDDRLMGWVIEARVEQKLSDATKIALRFEDDLCDGGSEMEGLLEVAETVFDGPVRRGVPASGIGGLVDVVSRPEWAVATGLLLYGQRSQSHRKPKGLSLTRVKKFFGDFF